MVAMVSAYSLGQLEAYERHVGLPTKYHHSANPALDINYLRALHIHQIAAVPYENLNLHYSTHHSVSLDPQVQFKKIVTDARGRGGYCMEGNLFYNNILKAAGFQAYTAGVRIRPRINGVPGGDYTGWVHVVNIITLPTGEKYVSDVSFGGDGPTKPIPLISGTILQNLGTQEIRLIHDNIPCQQNAEPKFWIYQYRNSVDKEWNSFYAFPEMEFFINDFQIMNYFTSNFVGGTNFQTERVLVVRFLKGDGEEDGIVEKVMLVDGEVKRNHGGSTRVERVCGSEEERLEALKEVFGIRLVEEEVLGIRGTITELLGTEKGA